MEGGVEFQGHVEKRILLYSNDPDGKPTSFTVKGIVKLPLEAKPNVHAESHLNAPSALKVLQAILIPFFEPVITTCPGPL